MLTNTVGDSDVVKLGVLLPLFFLPLIVFSLSCSSARHTAPLFDDVSKQTGLDFWHFSGATGALDLTEINGSGAALIDYDNDGDLDLYLIQGAVDGADKATVPVPPGWKPGNRLFRNNLIPSGKLSFTDVTEEAGVGYKGLGMGVAAGDYDNDGNTDLYVTNVGRNVLYHNNGNGTFTDVTKAAGVESSGWSSSAAFIDYDRDGLLDLVEIWSHYVRDSIRGVAMSQRAAEITAGRSTTNEPSRSSSATWEMASLKTLPPLWVSMRNADRASVS